MTFKSFIKINGQDLLKLKKGIEISTKNSAQSNKVCTTTFIWMAIHLDLFTNRETVSLGINMPQKNVIDTISWSWITKRNR